MSKKLPVTAHHTPVELSSAQSLDFDFYRGMPHFYFHYHFAFELTLVRNSCGRRLTGDTLSNYSENDLVLLGPGLPHTWIPEVEKGNRENFENYVIKFTKKSLGLELLNRLEFSHVKNLLGRADKGVSFSAAAREKIIPLMKDMREASPSVKVLNTLRILDIAGKDESCRQIVSDNYHYSLNERDQQALSRILEFIHQHHHQTIALSRIAKYANMSIPTFTRFFKRATGESFTRYLNKWRVERACLLLKETRMTVLEISLKIGFRNLSNFNRQFLKITSKTPVEFR